MLDPRIFGENDLPPGSLTEIGYVCIWAKFNGKWIFCLHRRSGTWELPGGHVEEGETAEDAAKRELWEETGAVEFTMTRCWDYNITNDNGTSGGCVYFAEVTRLDELPAYEMEKLCFTEDVPEDYTYNRDTTRGNLRRLELYMELYAKDEDKITCKIEKNNITE